MNSKMLITYFANMFFKKNESSFIHTFGISLLLSWFYAVCSQIIIPLPFNLVPLSIQPLPILLATSLFGWPAVYACILFLAQGACGAPFFAGMQGGIVRLMGPTGGYLIGFLIASFFIASAKNYKNNSLLITTVKLICAHGIIFVFGLLQLARFVPSAHLLASGLYPFISGAFIKIALQLFMMKKLQKKA